MIRERIELLKVVTALSVSLNPDRASRNKSSLWGNNASRVSCSCCGCCKSLEEAVARQIKRSMIFIPAMLWWK